MFALSLTKILTNNTLRNVANASRALSIANRLLARNQIVVPPLAESLSEGDIKFEKSVGDFVSEDDIVAAIETDKTSVPINSPFAGKIIELLVEDSTTVKPGQAVIVIDTDSQQVGETQKKPASHESHAVPPPKTDSVPQQTTQATPPQPPQAPVSSTPVKQVESVKNVSAELKSLANGRFGDISASQRTVTVVKMNRLRQRVASRLKEAQNTYAMLTTFNEIDMSRLIEMRKKYKEPFFKKHNLRLSFMSAFVKASAYALQDQPIVNAVIDNNQILYRNYVDISIAVATPKGLVVPVLRNVENMNFAGIERNIAELAEKAKNVALTVDDMEGGTFTISNGGVFGSLFGTPIINPPQSAILGMHAINEKPVAVNGQVVIRPIMVVALTYDHRLLDGRDAVTFLKKIKDVVEDPSILLLDL